MKHFPSFPFIEKPPSLFGISLIDLLITIGIFVGLLLVVGMFFVLGWSWSGFFTLPFFITLGLLTFLKMGNRNKQTHFLISLYCFYYLQEKQFYTRTGKLSIKSNYETQD